ncbi:uncharacterized protein LOC114528769 isoform X1 [Dendronephthya gigantea]|uniref:uncharacterized protein LOC114528769 isoform X1 n=1 Tax=Dendronephthya gigantea TaxID=151771 RepID=UPI0010696D77|nr:uncharacterized protein LOC114528769 isoform X1 [Dendronephthya gigantea]XP_028406282.1 uncharacterized protein LOC114528769 isoform X1 [Dendronephthya gigantea]
MFHRVMLENGNVSLHKMKSEESCYIIVAVKTLPIVYLSQFDNLKGILSLQCFIKGYFKPDKVVWYKDDEQILQNDTRYVVRTEQTNDFIITSSLSNDHPSLDDAGNYSCQASNKYGTGRTSSYLSKDQLIYGLLHRDCPEFTNKTEVYLTIYVGSSASLFCELKNNPYASPDQLVLLKMVIRGNKTTLYDIGGDGKHVYKKQEQRHGTMLINYTIVDAVRNDSGRYVCKFLHISRYYCPNDLERRYNVKVVAFPVKKGTKKELNLLMVIAVSVSGSLCGFALVLYVCYLRRKMKAKIYENCPDCLPELRWDVFVSYSSHDFGWVDNLCQMLEQPPFNLTVCLHQRDWELGRSLVDNMIDSVYCSHKTLIIVSKHYVQSEYCMQELQIAMHSEIASELVRRERIVLIKIDDVSIQRLPRALRQKSYLDCSNSEHARHFKTNLLRILPRRQALEDEPGPSSEQPRSDAGNTNETGDEIRLQQLEIG